MRRVLVLLFVFLGTLALLAQGGEEKRIAPTDFSGMYSFVREGEFLQLTVDDQKNVTGFISRYGDLDSDRGAFLDQFIKKGSTDGTKLEFTTEAVHGIWYDFQGTVTRGQGKTPNDEGYYVITGKLSRYTSDASKKVTSESRDLTMKSFPLDEDAAPGNRD